MKAHNVLTAGLILWVFLEGSVRAADDQTALGKSLFSRRCSGCHALDSNKGGPKLRGVFGRRLGSASDFPYSEALRNSELIWDEPLLNKWLADSDALVPGNDMDFRVPNPNERDAIIAYLKSLKTR